MKTKTSDLTDAALDWAVAKCLALEVYIDDGVVCLKGQPFDDNAHYWLPTQNWSQGGPIIEREGITHGPWDTSPAMAHYGPHMSVNGTNPRIVGPTPLIAAMRCYCSAKLGDEIDIPEELCQQQSS